MTSSLTNTALAARLGAVECPAFQVRRELRAGGEFSAPPIVLASGRGSELIDVEGKRYVDLAAGFGAVSLGHGHPALRAALDKQTQRLAQGLGDLYGSDTKLALLERLSSFFHEPRARVMLCQSGADAVTAALKTAMLATSRPGVLAFEGAYHGLGYAPLPACGYAAGFRTPFAEQLNQHVRFVPYPDARHDALDSTLERAETQLATGNIGAVLVEPIAGRGGCILPSAGFVSALAELAKRHGALLIADEIWTGLGRAGAWLSSVEQGAHADIICLGKGLGGGMPISACVARDEVMMAWARGGQVVHTSTHAGAPLGCAAALAVLDVIEQERLVERAARLGAAFVQRCREQLGGNEQLIDVRGAGLMVGVEFDSGSTAQRVSAELLERGYVVVTGGTNGATLTLTPALTIAEEQLMSFIDALAELLAD